MKYAIGIDFGTLSARGVLFSAEEGKVCAEAECVYPHGVMYEELGEARQDGEDYLLALDSVVRPLLQGIDAEEVGVIGVDFTSCTVLPVREDGTLLSSLPEFSGNREALGKLWKHHSAQTQAERLEAAFPPFFLRRIGGHLSSEAFFPKAAEWYEDAPEVWKAADLLIEAGDWITWQMTGRFCRSASMVSLKSQWEDGKYPPFDAMDRAIPGFGTEIGGKIQGEIVPICTVLGTVTPEFAARTGLSEKTRVTSCLVDAHASLPACGISEVGEALPILGTSAAVLVLTAQEHYVPDITGYTRDSMVPGLWGYESGQGSFGDHFAWAVEQITPAAYYEKAKEAGLNIHSYLTSLCKTKKPGESGLLALDWWNGSRVVCIDSDLSGMLIGLRLHTRPEDIYRALLEATCYGLRSIFDLLSEHGIEVRRILLSGGIPQKNPFLCQMLADVLDRPVSAVECRSSAAVGSALYALTAVGEVSSLQEAAQRFGAHSGTPYTPDPAASPVYDALYREYRTLTAYFHKENHVMKRLAAIRRTAVEK